MWKFLVLALALLLFANCSLIDDDQNIQLLFDKNFVNYGAYYPQYFISRMASESGPSQFPLLNSFNDPAIKQQLRKNVLLIIDKMASMQAANSSACSIQRLNEAKAIRDIYMNDEIFNNRPLPRYYHATVQGSVLPILESMVIKYRNITFPGAWFATGFYLVSDVHRYRPVFSFGSELELPLSQVSSGSHYMVMHGPNDYFGIGRLTDVPLGKSKTAIVQWAVEQQYVEQTTDYIKTHFDAEKASYLLSRLVPIDQIILERQLLTIAHAHTNDRANALLLSSLYITDLPLTPPELNFTFGQLVVLPTTFSEMYYGMVVSYDKISQQLSYLTLQVANRTTVLVSENQMYPWAINKWVPDDTITDMTVLLQLIADGKLLDRPPSTTVNLERSVKQIMTRVNKVTPEHNNSRRLVPFINGRICW